MIDGCALLVIPPGVWDKRCHRCKIAAVLYEIFLLQWEEIETRHPSSDMSMGCTHMLHE